LGFNRKTSAGCAPSAAAAGWGGSGLRRIPPAAPRGGSALYPARFHRPSAASPWDN